MANKDEKKAVVQPEWDGTDETKYRFLADLGRWLPRHNPKYRTLMLNGTVMIKNYVGVASAEHLNEIKAATIPKGTIQKPTPRKNSTSTTLKDTDKERYVIAIDKTQLAKRFRRIGERAFHDCIPHARRVWRFKLLEV